MGKLRGYDFLLFLTTGSTKYPVAGSKTCSLDDKKETLDTSSRDGKGFEVGESEYSISVDGLVDFTATGNTQTMTSIASIYQAKTNVNWAFGSSTSSTAPQTLSTGSKYFSGVGVISDLKINSAFEGIVEYSLTIKGIGDWTLT